MRYSWSGSEWYERRPREDVLLIPESELSKGYFDAVRRSRENVLQPIPLSELSKKYLKLSEVLRTLLNDAIVRLYAGLP